MRKSHNLTDIDFLRIQGSEGLGKQRSRWLTETVETSDAWRIQSADLVCDVIAALTEHSNNCHIDTRKYSNFSEYLV